MKLFNRLLWIYIIIFSMGGILYAQSEEDFDEKFLSEDEAVGSSMTGDNKDMVTPKWDYFGFIESNNHFSVTKNEDDDYDVMKIEGRVRLNARYGTDKMYAKTSLDGFYIPEEFEQDSSRKSGDVEAQELYVGGGDKIQFRLGKQLFQWGTADAFTLTNYMDQQDNRELFATDRDDRFRGVPALSLKFIFGEFALEAAATPVHNKPLLPEGPWAYSFDPVSLGATTLDTRISDNEAKNTSINNASYAARCGGTIGVLDFHFIYYNGINNTSILEPVITKENSEMYLNLKPYYERIQSFGVDMAFTIDKLSVRAEGSYSNNMLAVAMAGASDYQSAYSAASSGSDGDYKITDVEHAKYFAYVVGADYNLWGDNGIILVEWMQARYVDNDRYEDPSLSKVLLIRIEDSFYDEHIYTELNTTLRPIKKNPGFMINYKLGWDFKIGLTIEGGCYFFQGNDDDLFSLIEDKDMVYLKGRMEF